MISYKEKQRRLIRKIERKFKRGETPSSIVQPVKDFVNDNQICLTSVEFIPADIQEIIDNILIQPLKKIDKKHYFYPQNSLHLTIQNIRTIHYPPLFTKKDIGITRKMFSEIVKKYTAPVVHLQGLFELPWSLSLCVYSNETYEDMILNFRKALIQAGIPYDKKYSSENIVIGNVTFCRYNKKPNNSFMKKIKVLKNIDVGKFRLKNIFLITTNSVCHHDHTKILDKFSFQ